MAANTSLSLANTSAEMNTMNLSGLNISSSRAGLVLIKKDSGLAGEESEVTYLLEAAPFQYNGLSTAAPGLHDNNHEIL